MSSKEKVKEWMDSHWPMQISGHPEYTPIANYDELHLQSLEKILDTHAKEAQKEQRQMCADAVLAEALAPHTPDFKRACLNATNRDEK